MLNKTRTQFMHILLAITVQWLCLTNYSFASDIPGFDKKVQINATNESVNEVIHTLFAQVGVPVKIESNINGTVNGRFSGTAAEVFNRISKTYNVHTYYSRSVAYVYKADQISEHILPMGMVKANALLHLAQQMNLVDERNSLYLIKGAGLEVVGNQRFVKKVEELALNLNVAEKKQPKIKNTAAKNSAPTVREFRLKYASVEDTVVTLGDRDVRIPGVATLMRQFINGDIPSIGDTTAETAVAIKTKLTDSDTKPRILVHQHTNSLWIEDKASRMPIYKSMIDAIDQQPKMVEIEATVIDINNTRQKELGVNWRLTGDGNEALFGSGTVQDLLLNPGQQITPLGAGGFVSTVLGDKTQFISRINALEDLGAARVVSTPHIITLSNVEAMLGSAREFSVRLEGKEAVDLIDISYGTILRATPRVIGDGEGDGISLSISIEDGTTTGDSVDDIPERERSVVVSQTVVQNGQSLLIGGLTRETSQNFRSKVPLLGDIPAVGKLFQSNRQNTSITERLFLITPRIVGESRRTGPVLQGDATAIVDTSELRRKQVQSNVQEKANRQTQEINGTPAKDTIVFQETPLAQEDREYIKTLLNIPQKPMRVVSTETIAANLPITDQPASLEHSQVIWQETKQ